MQAVIDRSEQIELEVNAFSHTFIDSVMDQAREAEKKFTSGGDAGNRPGI